MYHVGKFLSTVTAIACLAALSACSQTPASISHNGDKFYGFDSSINSYNSSSRSNKSSTYGSKKHVWVKVKRGDTLSEIAERFDVPMQEVASVNKIRKPYTLEIGQLIKVGKAKYHVVERGDTLNAIANDYAVDMQALASANKIKSPYTIEVGEKIYMPGAPREKNTQVASKTSEKNHKNYSKTAKKAESTRRVKVAGAPVFNWPLKGKVIEGFGPRKGGAYNDGINIAAPEGTYVQASADGEVVYVGDELKAYGNLIIVKHDNGWLTAYAHNKDILVKRGDRVRTGQKISRVGKSGQVNSPQLHFAVRKGREAVDPANYL